MPTGMLYGSVVECVNMTVNAMQSMLVRLLERNYDQKSVGIVLVPIGSSDTFVVTGSPTILPPRRLRQLSFVLVLGLPLRFLRQGLDIGESHRDLDIRESCWDLDTRER